MEMPPSPAASEAPAPAISLPRGLFINAPRGNCSIYESGRMMYECLVLSRRYRLDYLEITEQSRDIPATYDFYAFNYHHVRMSWLDPASIRRLPGAKLTFVLETLPNDPFVLCPPSAFDAYCAIDPTMRVDDRRVFAFPRPLEASPPLPPPAEHEVPVIGTFGFATKGKGFELVVDAVNKEFPRAVVRINIPASEFSYSRGNSSRKKTYAEELADLATRTAKPGVEVRVTHDYFDKPELIRWCAENTLNCFLYDRRMPGLSATTDQAIVSGRPMAISSNPTFRHIHPYIAPYPQQSLTSAIETSMQGIRKMQADWAPENFATRFEGVISELGISPARPAGDRSNGTIQLGVLQPRVTLMGRARRVLRKARFRCEDVLDALHPTGVGARCKFLQSLPEVRQSTAYLRKHGFVSHRLVSKDWDLANILADLSDGDLLDMGSSDSFLLKNASIKGIRGRLFGIDLQQPDVPVDGVTYLVGDLTRTGLPAGQFQNISCLSVVEHNVDFSAFAREASRLLAPGGKLYVTFDYWEPKVTPNMNLFGQPWNILDSSAVHRLVEECGRSGLAPVSEIDWSLRRPLIGTRFPPPERGVSYTFGMLVFHKRPAL